MAPVLAALGLGLVILGIPVAITISILRHHHDPDCPECVVEMRNEQT